MNGNETKEVKNGSEKTIEHKPMDVLDEIKAIERVVRKKRLLAALTELKDKAHKILELKEECLSLLEAIGVSDEDQKRIIDYVNNSGDVVLSESEKKDIRTKAKEKEVSEKKKVETKIKEDPVVFNTLYSMLTGWKNNTYREHVPNGGAIWRGVDVSLTDNSSGELPMAQNTAGSDVAFISSLVKS